MLASGPNYPKAARNCVPAGARVGELIRGLEEVGGAMLEDFHTVGFSLGGQESIFFLIRDPVVAISLIRVRGGLNATICEPLISEISWNIVLLLHYRTHTLVRVRFHNIGFIKLTFKFCVFFGVSNVIHDMTLDAQKKTKVLMHKIHKFSVKRMGSGCCRVTNQMMKKY